MAITALAPWFGSNRTLGSHVGKLLAGCEWVGVPFAGGMAELAHIKARTMLVSDLHRHVINLAMVVANDSDRALLVDYLENMPCHPDSLSGAQRFCLAIEKLTPEQSDNLRNKAEWASHYFICAWMSRNGTAGTSNEFTAGKSTRWNASGGDSVVRFRNATKALEDWAAIMRRCDFVCEDVFDFLAKVHDKPKHGLYLDPPFPGPGDKYKHNPGKGPEQELWHLKLATRLRGFNQCRVVCRFYDVPLIRKYYPESHWTWHFLTGRDQANQSKPEVLLVNDVQRDLFSGTTT